MGIGNALGLLGILTPMVWASAAFAAQLSQTQAIGPDEFYGMHVGFDAYPPKAIPALNDLGVKWVRVWTNVDWGKKAETDSFQMARDFKEAGFKVVMVFQQSKVPTYEVVKDYFDWAQAAPGMKQSIDVWEILNELNVKKYWSGTYPGQYVNNVLKPAWDSLHPQGEKVLGGAFTAYQDGGNTKLGTSFSQAYVEAGYLNYVDYVGSHPYTKTIPELKTHLQEVKEIYGDKPILVTEWNFKPQSDEETWTAMLDEVRPYLQERVDAAFYYRLLASRDGLWPGVVSSESNSDSYRPVEPFYSMYKGWTKSDAGSAQALSLGEQAVVSAPAPSSTLGLIVLGILSSGYLLRYRDK